MAGKTRNTTGGNGTKTAQDALDAMMTAGREAMDEGCRKAAAMSKDNLDTFAAMAGALVAGYEACSAGLVQAAKAATGQNAAFVSKALAAKTPQDLTAVQVEAMATGLDAAFAHTVELNRIAADTLARCVGPVKERIDGAMADFARPFAL